MSELYHIKEFLDEKVLQYNSKAFISSDPIQVPHSFSKKEDIEIAGFLTATIAWGQRTTIINNARKLVQEMPGGPHDFLLNASDDDLQGFITFVHRTFNGFDCIYFLKSLRNIYQNFGGLGVVFEDSFSSNNNIFYTLVEFRDLFLSLPESGRTSRHVSNVMKGSAAKRLNMFLRWMIRNDHNDVDFGLWKKIPMSALFVPLDLHSGNSARKLGLLKRKQNDWKAVEELTNTLREFDPDDPVKYDYALFGLGVFEKF